MNNAYVNKPLTLGSVGVIILTWTPFSFWRWFEGYL